MWSPEFSELVDRQSIHQLDATCKKNKKTTVVFRRSSDGKVSLFLEDLELRVTVYRLKISYLIWCDMLLFYGGRKEDPSFFKSRRFLPIMFGKVALILGKMTYSSLYVTAFLIEPLLRELSYSVKGDGVSSWENSHL